jgi:hypothetical protein
MTLPYHLRLGSSCIKTLGWLIVPRRPGQTNKGWCEYQFSDLCGRAVQQARSLIPKRPSRLTPTARCRPDTTSCVQDLPSNHFDPFPPNTRSAPGSLFCAPLDSWWNALACQYSPILISFNRLIICPAFLACNPCIETVPCRTVCVRDIIDYDTRSQ